MVRKAFKKGYVVFVIPSIVLFAFCVAYPFISGFPLAFTDWDGISRTYNYIGLSNFKMLFTDRDVLMPLKNTLVYGIGVTVLNNIFALSLASVLSKRMRGIKFFKTVYFMPLAISAVLASFVWRYIFSSMLSNITGQSLLSSKSTVLIGIMIISLWNNLGSNTMIYIAGLAGVPDDYREAAMIDGANRRQIFWNVVIPMLMPSFSICITLTLTSSLREFGLVLAATGGGPAGSSQTMSLLIYNNMFKYSNAGYAQAISLVFMIALIIIGLALNKFFRSREVEA